MYYATFKNIGKSDIVAFKTKSERNNWVKFKDSFSKSLNINKKNCTFKRKALFSKIAEERVIYMKHRTYEWNPEQEWYQIS